MYVSVSVCVHSHRLRIRCFFSSSSFSFAHIRSLALMAAAAVASVCVCVCCLVLFSTDSAFEAIRNLCVCRCMGANFVILLVDRMFAVAVVCVRVSKQTTMGTETTPNYDATRMCCCCRESVCVCVCVYLTREQCHVFVSERNERMNEHFI